jgi:hypothetical protein
MHVEAKMFILGLLGLFMHKIGSKKSILNPYCMDIEVVLSW